MRRFERQASILRRAAEAFATGGYAATSMDDVAEAAGVTKLILYRYFDSKEELYRAALEQVSGRLFEEFAGAWSRGEREGVSARTFLRIGREDPFGFRLLWRHSARETPFADYAARLRERAVDGAQLLIAPVLTDPSLQHWAAETAVAFLVEAVLNWIEHGDPNRDDEFVDMMTASLYAAVKAWSTVSTKRSRKG
jgi:AcrR family transcriptional regulator